MSGRDDFGYKPEKIVYDGRRLRKQITRKTCDFNSTVAYWLQQRAQFKDERATPTLLPCPSQVPELLPIMAYRNNPANAICTRFMAKAMNKEKCPINVVTWVPNARRMITGTSTGEFTLWNGLTFNFDTIQQAHDCKIRCMEWSKDERWLLSGDEQGNLKYWQTSLNEVERIKAHSDSTRAVSFSPSDVKFASCGDDGLVKVYDFTSAREEQVLKGHGWDVKDVHWHPQKALIVSGSKDNTVKLWDPKSGLEIKTLNEHKHTVSCTQFSPNGMMLATAGRDQLIHLYDIRKMVRFHTYHGHRKEVTAMRWHPIYETLLATGDFEGTIMYWNVGQADCVGEVTRGHDDAIWSLAWHPLGHILCSGSNDRSARFWIRNRPGDLMDDSYNYVSVTGRLPADTETIVQHRGGDSRREFQRGRFGGGGDRSGANTAPLANPRTFPAANGGGGGSGGGGRRPPEQSPGGAPAPKRSRFN